MTTLLNPDHRVLVTDPLDDTAQQTGDSPYQVFTDWVDITLASFTGDEDVYQKPIQRYERDGRDEDTIRSVLENHATALAGLVDAMEQTDEDVLGGVYEFYGLTSDYFAQYFTPGAVSRAIAEMNLPSAERIREATIEDPLVIGDISGCGSGRLVVDSAKRLRDLAPEAPAVFLGYDKDPICAKMTVLNFLLNDLTGYVLLGDALKLEAHRVWIINTGFFARGEHPIKELSKDERNRVLARFFGVPLDDTDTDGETVEDSEEGQTDAEPSAAQPPEPRKLSVDVRLDVENTSQVGFDEFA